MCTLTSNVPSSFFLIDRASSMSLAVGGSIVKTRSDRRSFLTSNSRSGILPISSGSPAKQSEIHTTRGEEEDT